MVRTNDPTRALNGKQAIDRELQRRNIRQSRVLVLPNYPDEQERKSKQYRLDIAQTCVRSLEKKVEELEKSHLGKIVRIRSARLELEQWKEKVRDIKQSIKNHITKTSRYVRPDTPGLSSSTQVAQPALAGQDTSSTTQPARSSAQHIITAAQQPRTTQAHTASEGTSTSSARPPQASTSRAQVPQASTSKTPPSEPKITTSSPIRLRSPAVFNSNWCRPFEDIVPPIMPPSFKAVNGPNPSPLKPTSSPLSQSESSSSSKDRKKHATLPSSPKPAVNNDETLQRKDCAAHYHYRLSSNWDPTSMQRHKRERNGKWVHNDYLLSAIEDNALLDWITKPVKLKGRKQDWSNVGLPQQEAFKDFMDHCPAEDAVEVLQKYNIVRVQALRDFVWPVHTRDYEAARHRNGDRYVQVKDRHIGYIWAFDAGGVFHGDIIDRLIEMHPEDEDLARAAEASRHNGKAKPAGERRGRPKGTNNRTSLTGAADSNVGREASPNPPTPGRRSIKSEDESDVGSPDRCIDDGIIALGSESRKAVKQAQEARIRSSRTEYAELRRQHEFEKQRNASLQDENRRLKERLASQKQASSHRPIFNEHDSRTPFQQINDIPDVDEETPMITPEADQLLKSFMRNNVPTAGDEPAHGESARLSKTSTRTPLKQTGSGDSASLFCTPDTPHITYSAISSEDDDPQRQEQERVALLRDFNASNSNPSRNAPSTPVRSRSSPRLASKASKNNGVASNTLADSSSSPHAGHSSSPCGPITASSQTSISSTSSAPVTPVRRSAKRKTKQIRVFGGFEQSDDEGESPTSASRQPQQSVQHGESSSQEDPFALPSSQLSPALHLATPELLSDSQLRRRGLNMRSADQAWLDAYKSRISDGEDAVAFFLLSEETEADLLELTNIIEGLLHYASESVKAELHIAVNGIRSSKDNKPLLSQQVKQRIGNVLDIANDDLIDKQGKVNAARLDDPQTPTSPCPWFDDGMMLPPESPPWPRSTTKAHAGKSTPGSQQDESVSAAPESRDNATAQDQDTTIMKSPAANNVDVANGAAKASSASRPANAFEAALEEATGAYDEWKEHDHDADRARRLADCLEVLKLHVEAEAKSKIIMAIDELRYMDDACEHHLLLAVLEVVDDALEAASNTLLKHPRTAKDKQRHDTPSPTGRSKITKASQESPVRPDPAAPQPPALGTPFQSPSKDKGKGKCKDFVGDHASTSPKHSAPNSPATPGPSQVSASSAKKTPTPHTSKRPKIIASTSCPTPAVVPEAEEATSSTSKKPKKGKNKSKSRKQDEADDDGFVSAVESQSSQARDGSKKRSSADTHKNDEAAVAGPSTGEPAADSSVLEEVDRTKKKQKTSHPAARPSPATNVPQCPLPLLASDPRPQQNTNVPRVHQSSSSTAQKPPLGKKKVQELLRKSRQTSTKLVLPQDRTLSKSTYHFLKGSIGRAAAIDAIESAGCAIDDVVELPVQHSASSQPVDESESSQQTSRGAQVTDTTRTQAATSGNVTTGHTMSSSQRNPDLVKKSKKRAAETELDDAAVTDTPSRSTASSSESTSSRKKSKTRPAETEIADVEATSTPSSGTASSAGSPSSREKNKKSSKEPSEAIGEVIDTSAQTSSDHDVARTSQGSSSRAPVTPVQTKNITARTMVDANRQRSSSAITAHAAQSSSSRGPRNQTPHARTSQASSSQAPATPVSSGSSAARTMIDANLQQSSPAMNAEVEQRSPSRTPQGRQSQTPHTRSPAHNNRNATQYRPGNVSNYQRAATTPLRSRQQMYSGHQGYAAHWEPYPRQKYRPGPSARQRSPQAHQGRQSPYRTANARRQYNGNNNHQSQRDGQSYRDETPSPLRSSQERVVADWVGRLGPESLGKVLDIKELRPMILPEIVRQMNRSRR